VSSTVASGNDALRKALAATLLVRSLCIWPLDNSQLDEVAQPTPGGHVLYFGDDDWQHIGILTGTDRATSM
jgi:hypothetical protein